jgi:maltooligosyltrehalose trehalohydrolase
MWLRDYHVDGLRLDAVHAIIDTSAVHLLEQLSVEVEALAAAVGRPLHLIAESDLNDPRLIWSREVGGYGMDAQWSDDLHHALHAVVTGERAGYYEDFGRVSQIATALRRAFVYAGEHSGFRRRRHGRPPGDVPGWRFLGYIQNHDQIGNRAQGERISHLTSDDQVRAASALVFASPFVPMIFQGEEWAASSPFQYFTDHRDPELARAVSEGRRREFASFGWAPEDVPDPQDRATFERSKLDWTELQLPQHAEMLEHYRSIIARRRAHPELRDGRMDRVHVEADDGSGALTLRRGPVTIPVTLGVVRR